jgi:predicted secreted protein
MVKTAGRDCVITITDTAIAGARVKGITRNMTPIDISDSDDNEFMTMLTDTFSEDTMEITVSGVEDGTVLRDIAFSTSAADRHISDLAFEFAGTPADEVTGEFIMTAFTITGDYREATTFDATFVRSGQHTFTQGV